MDKQIIISFKTILFAFTLALAGYVIYRLSSIFGLFFLAFLIVLAMEPLIGYIQRKKFMNKYIDRTSSVIISYLFIVIAFIGLFTIGLPPILLQLEKLIGESITLLSSLNIDGGVEKYITEALSQLVSVSGSLFSTTLSVFQAFLTLISLLLISILLSLDWLNLKEKLISLLPNKLQDKFSNIILEIEANVGAWIKGQLILMLFIGVLSYIGLFILGIDYALALALIAGLLEIVPMIGPIVTAILAGIVGFSISPIKGLAIIILFTLIQQIENNLLVPKIMQKVSGFNPLIIILAFSIGGELFGIVGAIVAVPTTMIGYIIIKQLVFER